MSIPAVSSAKDLNAINRLQLVAKCLAMGNPEIAQKLTWDDQQ